MNDIHLFSIKSASLATLTMWSFMAWESSRPCKVFLFTKNQLLLSVITSFCRQEYYGLFLHKVITCSYFMIIFVHQIHCKMHIWMMVDLFIYVMVKHVANFILSWNKFLCKQTLNRTQWDKDYWCMWGSSRRATMEPTEQATWRVTVWGSSTYLGRTILPRAMRIAGVITHWP